MASELAARVLADWAVRDRALGWIPDDQRALTHTDSLRALLVELLVDAGGATGTLPADVYHACIRLGVELAARGASPTLAATAFDAGGAALRAHGLALDEAVWRALRAALFEGFVRAVREEAERTSFASFEPPRCIVMLERGVAAVAATHAATEPDVLAAWAGRVTGGLLVRGVRRVHVGGEGPAALALRDAVVDAGIDLAERMPDPAPPPAGPPSSRAARGSTGSRDPHR